MCVICVQGLASDLEELKNPSTCTSEGRRKELEGRVKGWKEAIQAHKDNLESCDSQLRGESCPKGNRS